MARYDHYENGEWVGTTEVPGTSNADGWVHTYSADGKSRSTWVSNPAQYDYSYNSQPKSWEDRKAENEALHSVINFILTLSFKVGLPMMLIVGVVLFVYFVKEMGIQGFLNGVIEFMVEAPDVTITCIVFLVIPFFIIVKEAVDKIKKKTKKEKGNAIGAHSGKITNQTNETTQEKKSINLVELVEMQRKRSDEEWL